MDEMALSPEVQHNDWEWLSMFYQSAKEVGEIVVDDFATIKRRMIDKNKEDLKKDSGLNSWLAKNVVKNFVQSITKSIENLSELKLDVIRELKTRYPTLEGDWLSENCVTVSSSVKSPTCIDDKNGEAPVPEENNSIIIGVKKDIFEDPSDSDEDVPTKTSVKTKQVRQKPNNPTKSLKLKSNNHSSESDNGDDLKKDKSLLRSKKLKILDDAPAPHLKTADDLELNIAGDILQLSTVDDPLKQSTSKDLLLLNSDFPLQLNASVDPLQPNAGKNSSVSSLPSETVGLSEDAASNQCNDVSMLSEPELDIIPPSPPTSELGSPLPLHGDNNDENGDSAVPVEKENEMQPVVGQDEDQDMLSPPCKNSKETEIANNPSDPSSTAKEKKIKRKTLDKESLKAKKNVLMSDSSEDEDFKPTPRRKPTKSSREKSQPKTSDVPEKKAKESRRTKSIQTSEEDEKEKTARSENPKVERKATDKRGKRKVDPDYWKNHDIKDDLKLQSIDKTKVVLEKLDKNMEEVLEAVGFIHLATDSSESESEIADKRITRALRNFEKFDPILTSEKKEQNKTPTKQGRSLRSRKRKPETKYEDTITISGSDDNSSDGSIRVSPLKTKPTRDSSSDQESLSDNNKSGSDDDKAKKKVLDDSDDELLIAKKEKKGKDEKSDKDCKPNSKRYFTPAVCRLNLNSSSEDEQNKQKNKKPSEKGAKKEKTKKFSEDDSSDEFIPPKTRRGKKKVASETEEISDGSSDDDSSDSSGRKKNKRRNKRQNSSSSEEEKPRTKKRRRIKVPDSDDSENSKKQNASDSDVQEIDNDNKDSPTKGRKNIRKVMSKKELEKSTREAEKEEDERKRRVLEKQKMFNSQFEAPASDVLESLVLDFDSKTKAPTISADTTIVCKLKPHQAKGVKFMYDCTIESTEKKDNPGGGCIIAHCMGLGKTLSTITFVHTALTHKSLNFRTALIICPLNTVTNWYNELRQWLSDVDIRVNVHKLWDQKTNKDRASALAYFMRKGGVGIIHYDLFRRLSDLKGQKQVSEKLKQQIQEHLVDPGSDIVVCDEGHMLKNDKSKLSIAVNKIRTRRRIVLTGTPLQNNLAEYHTMMSFVKPNLLGTLKEFQNRFINPIKNGQHADSGDYDVKLMKKRAHVLHKLLDGCVQRLDYNALSPYLPPKHEYVVMVKMSPKQVELYKHYLANLMDRTSLIDRHRTILKNYSYLQKVWTHPIILTRIKPKKGERNASGSGSDSDGSMKDFIVDGSGESSSKSSDSDSDIDWVSAHNKKVKKRKEEAKNKEPIAPVEENPDVTAQELPKDWYLNFFESKEDMMDIELGGKFMVLMEILKICESIGDKLLVFSQYLSSLDLIEEFLENWDRESRENERRSAITFPQNLDLSTGRWRKNIEYYRIDGGTKTDVRQDQCDKFNSKFTSKAKLFLISTKAGGLGINLVGANRVVIFDASWNPSQDMQSVFRVYRFGQQKPCYIYRLLAEGTMEEKIYNRQVVKLSLSGRVVDEHQIERHFKFDETNSLYLYEDPDEKVDRPIPPVPKDRLLADLLISQKDRITTYLEHDTLLENKMDEGLTEEERKAAWDEYHNEKEQRVQMQPGISGADGTTYAKIWKILEQRYNFAPEQLKMWSDQILRKINELQVQLNYYNMHQHALSPEEEQIRKKSIEDLRQWISKALGTNNTTTNQPNATTSSHSGLQNNSMQTFQRFPQPQQQPMQYPAAPASYRPMFRPVFSNPMLAEGQIPQIDISQSILNQQLQRPPVEVSPAISQGMQNALSKVAGNRPWNSNV